MKGFFTILFCVIVIYGLFNFGKGVYRASQDNRGVSVVYWLLILLFIGWLALLENAGPRSFGVIHATSDPLDMMEQAFRRLTAGDRKFLFMAGAIPIATLCGYFADAFLMDLDRIRGGVLGILGAATSYTLRHELMGYGIAEASLNSFVTAGILTFAGYKA